MAKRKTQREARPPRSSTARSLPRVPSHDANAARDAESTVQQARASVLGMRPVGATAEDLKKWKPSGAYNRKAARARQLGLEPPPRPEPPAHVTLPPANDAPPPSVRVEPSPAPTAPARLTESDLAAAESERVTESARVEGERVAGEQRALILSGDERARLESRVGSVAQLAFTYTGYVLGDFTDENWPLIEQQEKQIGVLLVEAFPDELAALMQGGTLVKVIAIATVARIAGEKWQRHKLRRRPVAAPPASVAAPVRERPRFAGVSDMQRQPVQG